MFYDLERPLEFVQDVVDVLADDGIWHLEQSYLPAMLEVTAYDTICHEHLEYYSLTQLKWIADRVGLKIIDVELNDVNGGSFSVTLCKRDAGYPESDSQVQVVLSREAEMGLGSIEAYKPFRERVLRHRDKLRDAIHQINKEQQLVLGYGASTRS